jgi:Flp pilus assembly protein TadG
MSGDTERTPLVHTTSLSSTRGALDVESVAPAAPSVEYIDDVDDLTPFASHKRWPRKRGVSALVFALLALVLVGVVLFAMEPSSASASASAAATPASPNAETLRETAAAEASGIATSTTSARVEATATAVVDEDAPPGDDAETSTATATAETETEAVASPPPPHHATTLSWDDVVAVEDEEAPATRADSDVDGAVTSETVTTSDASGADASDSDAVSATVSTSTVNEAKPEPEPEAVRVSLATRHSFSNAEFAIGVVEACATHTTALACTGQKDVYGCAWLDGACRVGCDVFESKIGCVTQGDLCSYDVDGGGCSYTPSDCDSFNAAVACTTAGSSKCGWLKDKCFDRNTVMRGCVLRDKATCEVTNPDDHEEIPCMWHTPRTLSINGVVEYIGDEENFENTNRTGICVTELPCAQHTNPDACATQAPMCVYDYASSACVHTKTIQDSYRVCSTASDALNTCPDANNGAKLFCNFNFEHSGYCQRCTTMTTVDACLELVVEAGQQRCISKCFTANETDRSAM